MTYEQDTQDGATAGGSIEILTGAQLESALAVLPYGVADDVTLVLRIELPPGALDEGTPHIIVYHHCVSGHIVMEVGHEDPATGMSVYDGSVPTTIPCPSSNAPSPESSKGRLEMLAGSQLAAALNALPDAVAAGNPTMFAIHAPTSSDDEFPLGATWSTAACENHHIVMHFGHEDTVTHTSVYDGSTPTSIAC